MPVRPAHRGDLAALTTLRAAWRGSAVTPEFAGTFAEWFDAEGAQRWWWLATEESDASVGMVNLRRYTRMPSPSAPVSQWGYLANLYVPPAHRGHGLGGALLSTLLTRAGDEGLVRVVLSPSTASRPLYTRHGFGAADGLLVRELGPTL